MADTNQNFNQGIPANANMSAVNNSIANQSISVDGLANTPSAPALPNAPTLSPVDITDGHAAIAGNASALAAPAIPPVDPTTASPSWYQNVLSLIKPAPATDTYTTDSNNADITGLQTKANSDQQAVVDAQSNLDNLNAQLKVYSDKAESIPIQDQQDALGKGITTAGNAPLDSAALRNNALAAIPVQAQVLAAQAKVASAQGNATLSQNILTQAQSQVDKLFQIQTTDAQNQYNYQKSIIDTYYQYATTQQQAALDAKKTQDAQDFQTQQNNLNQGQTLANTAIANGASDVAGKIMALDPKSTTYSKDLGALAAQIPQKPSAATTTWSTPYTYNGQTVQMSSNGELKVVGSAGSGNTEVTTAIDSLINAGYSPSNDVTYTVQSGQGSGYLTQQGFQSLVQMAAENGMSRKDFLAQYGAQLDPNGYANYGLTQQEISTLSNINKAKA